MDDPILAVDSPQDIVSTAERLRQVRELASPEEHQHDDQDDEKLLIAQPKHGVLLSPQRLTLAPCLGATQDPALAGQCREALAAADRIAALVRSVPG